MDLLKVGELARRTGLTVRTLHHYDDVGLLPPSRRTEAGYRLYDRSGVERLTRILLLRRLGLSLDEIRSSLDDPRLSLARTLEIQIGRLREEIEGSTRLLRRLEALVDRARGAEGAPAEDLMETLEILTMYEKHFTAEQLRHIEERGREVGAARIAEVEQEWTKLIAEVRSAMERGVEPTSQEAQALAARWRGLVEEFTGGDAGIARSVANLYRNGPKARERSGIDPATMEWIGKARSAS